MKKQTIWALIAMIAVVIAAQALAGVIELSDPTYKRASNVVGYHYTETIADGLTGNDIHILPMGLDGTSITCTIIAGANTGYFEYTTSSDAAVIAQTAVWGPWPLGTVTGTVSDALISQVTGLRGVSAAGEVTIEIVY